jgi:hypothetical protein
MSITSAKSGATAISLALDNNFMEPIASALVGAGGVGGVVFDDIPQTYKHLQVRVHGRTNRGIFRDFISLNFNSDYSNIYPQHGLSGDGSSASAGGVAPFTEIQIAMVGGGTGIANAFGAVIIDVLDYTNINKFKTIRALGGYDDNGQGVVALNSGSWMDTTAVNNIVITPGIGSLFVQHTRVSLYGIKG